MRVSAYLLTCLLALSIFLPGTQAAIMAIDLGSEFLKISIVKPGRIPISIVPNELSKRKSPVAVAMINGDRLIADEAASLSVRYPDRVYTRLRDLLGRRYDDPHVQDLIKSNLLGYSITQAPNRSTIAVTTSDTQETFTAEELVASLLEYAKNLANQVSDGSPVTDCVLVVPAFWSPMQRRSLLDAAELAGLNVMSLVHTHAAAALQYGIERDFTNKTEDVIFYDLGAGAVEVALVRFSSYPSGGPKNEAISQFEVRDVAWVDHDVGCDALEAALVQHFAAQHSGGKEEILKSPRAVAKLQKAVKRTKQVLSANTEAPISIEDLLPGIDFRGSINREQFEDLAGSVWSRAATPLATLISRNNLSVSDLSAVELLGGCSRVPRVKSELSKVLDGRQLDMHVDADEAVVLGAGLYAANLSTIFRLRKFGMTDKAPYSVTFTLEGADEEEKGGVDVADGEAKEKVLVPVLRKIPTKRAIALHNVTSDSFTVEIFYDDANGAVLPCCQRQESVGVWNVSGITSIVDKHGYSGKVALHTGVDAGGMLNVDRADAALEVEEEIKVKLPGNGDNKTNKTAAAMDESGIKTNTTENASNTTSNSTVEEDISKYITKNVKSMKKSPLKISGNFHIPPLTQQQRLASRKTLRTLRERDEAKRATAKARNDLEAYIISMREKLESDEAVKEASTEEERTTISAALNNAEEWLYGDGDTAKALELQEKLAEIRANGDKIEGRVFEAEKRPETIATAREFLKATSTAMLGWAKEKPWLLEDESLASDVEKLKTQVKEFEEWLEKSVVEQEKKKKHQEPTFTVIDVAIRMADVKRAFTRLSIRSKPVKVDKVNEKEAESQKNETIAEEKTSETSDAEIKEETKPQEQHDEL